MNQSVEKAAENIIAVAEECDEPLDEITAELLERLGDHIYDEAKHYPEHSLDAFYHKLRNRINDRIDN